MKIISLIVLFCLSLNVMAATGSVQALEKALDDYQYALTVEWDQKDAKVYEAQTNAFFTKLAELKAQGLTTTEINSLLEKKMSNKQALEALKLKLSVLSDVKSSEALAAVLKDSTKDLYSHGASWNGDMALIWGVGALFAALIVYEIWFQANHECAQYEQQWVCNTYSDCNDSYYNDDYYSSSYCSSSTTTCGWEDVCTLWVKKGSNK